MRCEAKGLSPGAAYRATPVALRWILVLSLAVGLALTVHWSQGSQRVILRSPLHIDGASAVGWPDCIQGARARIEDMARLDEALTGWRAGEEQRRRRHLLQTEADGQDSGGGWKERSSGAADGSRAAQLLSNSDSSGGSTKGDSMVEAAGGQPAAAADGGSSRKAGSAAKGSKKGRKSAKAQAKRPKRRPKIAPEPPGIATMDTWQEHVEKRRQRRRSGPSALIAVVTANVWTKTELLLQSLTANRDAFEVLVIDELSDDETPQRLHQYGVRIVTPSERMGVTYNWNIAYRLWLQSDHEYLFYVNNDVLVPDGAINALAQAMSPKRGDCDLVTPQSTVKGKGYWGPVEGLELMLNLSDAGSAFVNSPLNFRRVQEALQQGGCMGKLAVKEESWLHEDRPGFSGFFFGVRRSIQEWAYDEHNLFNTTEFYRNFGQEQDLLDRSTDPTLSHRAKLCMHTGVFVYHFKGSTLPTDAGGRAAWHLAPKTAQASADVEQVET